MLFRLAVAALLATLLLAGAGLPAYADDPGSTRDRFAALDQTAERALHDLDAPGGAWAVVRDGRVVHTGSTGRDGKGNPFTDRTRVMLGSVSKPLVATVAVELDRRGRLDLDEPVAQRLPTLAQRIPGSETITARQLLAHTSGLPFAGKDVDVDDPHRTPAQALDQLTGVTLASAPGAEYHYSGLGYVVLAAWLESTTGESLAQLLPAELPLPDAAYTAEDAAALAGGRRDLGFPIQDATFDGAGLAYGYSMGSTRTLAALATELLRDPDRLAAMTQVRPAPGQTLTGLGWRVTEDRVWHTGMVPGYFTAVHTVPSEGLAVVFATNRSGYLDQQRLYDASAGLLAVARGATPAAVGAPTTTYAALAAALLSGALAAFLVSRRGSRRSRLAAATGGLLAAALAAVPVFLTLSQGMRVGAALLWAPTLTVTCVGAAALGVVAGLLWRRRRVSAPTG